MRFLMTPAALLLASLGIQQAQAQSAYTWERGEHLSFLGNKMNGCNLAVWRATHSGSLDRNSIFVTVWNGSANSAMQITADVTYHADNGRIFKRGTIAGVVQPGSRMASLQAFPPGGHTLNGSRLLVAFTGCRPQMPPNPF